MCCSTGNLDLHQTDLAPCCGLTQAELSFYLGFNLPGRPGTSRAIVFLTILEPPGFWVKPSGQETQAFIFQKGNPSQLVENKLLLSD